MAEAVRHTDVALTICGEGPQRGAIERQVSARGLTGRVRLMGHQTNPYPWVAAADAILLTSDYEGLPNAVVEAQCLGRPAIATRCAYGVEEVIEDGRSGLLAPPGDAESVAAAIVRLAGDRELCKRLGREGRTRAEDRFSLSAAWPAYDKLFQEALTHGSAPAPQ